MTSATPAHSQIAPWIASSIWFLLSWFWFPSFGYRVFLRDRRRFKKTIMMPPATIHMPACRIVSVVIVFALLCLSMYRFHHWEEVLEHL
jgi:hypothetical protein